MQQRCIPPLIVEWLHQYGSVVHTHGAKKLYFDKNARKRLARDAGEQVVRRLNRLLDTYLVVSGDTVITAAHRFERIKLK
jgi:hypothetical protein